MRTWQSLRDVTRRLAAAASTLAVAGTLVCGIGSSAWADGEPPATWAAAPVLASVNQSSSAPIAAYIRSSMCDPDGDGPLTASTSEYGSVVRITPGVTTPVDATVTYEWLINGVPSGQTAATYTVGPNDRTLALRATAAAPGYAAGVVETPALTVAAINVSGCAAGTAGPTGADNTDTGSERIRIAGKPVLGQPLSIRYVGAGTVVGVEWLRGSAQISGATKTSYIPKRADLGRRLLARVSVQLSSGQRAVLTQRTPVVRAR